MQRKGLRLKLAEAIDDTLPYGHLLTIANVRRHVTRVILTRYRVRFETVVHPEDWIQAVQILTIDRNNRMMNIGNSTKYPVLWCELPRKSRFNRIVTEM